MPKKASTADETKSVVEGSPKSNADENSVTTAQECEDNFKKPKDVGLKRENGQKPLKNTTPKNSPEKTVKQDASDVIDSSESFTLEDIKEEHPKDCKENDDDIGNEVTEPVENTVLITVNKIETVDNLEEYNQEPVNSPQISTSGDIVSKESHSESRQKLENNTKRTPKSCKKKNRVRGDVTPEYVPRKLRKRKDSHVSDYDQLSDTTKAEMLETSYINEFEAIDLLHDIHSVMDFEDTKISSDILLSSLNFNNVPREDLRENLENCADPAMDPLFIANSDEKTGHDADFTCTNSLHEIKAECDEDNLVYIQRRSGKYNMRTLKIKKSTDLSKESEALEEEELLKSARKCLYNLEVKLQHTVPPQHKIEQGAGSIPPTQVQKKMFFKYGPLRKGTFSATEDCIIRNNWKMFCKVHNWDSKEVKPFLNMRHGNKFCIRKNRERQKFVQFLANGLPWRTLYSVYHRFRKLYEQYENMYSRYSAAEDKEILAYAQKCKSKKKGNQMYSTLSKLLGRTRHSVWMRHQTLKKMQRGTEAPLTKVDWTLSLIGKFIKCLMQITLSEEIDELKDATLPKPIWQKLEEQLNIDNGVLKSFWIQQLHMQLFCPHPIYLNDIKMQLIEYIYGKGISNTREIIWPNVAKYFEGMTTVFLCKVFFDLVREISSKTMLTHFPSIIEYLYHEKIPEIRKDRTDKYLPRLIYTNGKVEIINDDISNYISGDEI